MLSTRDEHIDYDKRYSFFVVKMKIKELGGRNKRKEEKLSFILNTRFGEKLFLLKNCFFAF